MARITVEDCLTQENNRFALVQLASKRTKQLLAGSRSLASEAKGNKAVVTALREIAEGAVRFMTDDDRAIVLAREERARELEAQRREHTPDIGSDLFIAPSNGAKGKNGSFHVDAEIEDDEEDGTDDEIEEIDDADDSDDADESDVEVEAAGSDDEKKEETIAEKEEEKIPDTEEE